MKYRGIIRGGLSGAPVENLTRQDQQWLDAEILELCKGKKPRRHRLPHHERLTPGRRQSLGNAGFVETGSYIPL